MENAKLTIDTINEIFNQMDHHEKHKILLLCKSTNYNIKGQLQNEIKERQEGARKIARLLPEIIDAKDDLKETDNHYIFHSHYPIRTFYEDGTYYNYERYNNKRIYQIILKQLIKYVKIKKWYKPKNIN